MKFEVTIPDKIAKRIVKYELDHFDQAGETEPLKIESILRDTLGYQLQQVYEVVYSPTFKKISPSQSSIKPRGGEMNG